MYVCLSIRWRKSEYVVEFVDAMLWCFIPPTKRKRKLSENVLQSCRSNFLKSATRFVERCETKAVSQPRRAQTRIVATAPRHNPEIPTRTFSLLLTKAGPSCRSSSKQERGVAGRGRLSLQQSLLPSPPPYPPLLLSFLLFLSFSHFCLLGIRIEGT